MAFTVDKQLCIACGACVRACPRGIFSPDEQGKMDTLQAKCLNCFHCTAICPTRAVRCSDVPDAQLYTEFCSDDPLYALMQKRRSIRNFGPALPDRELLRRVLDRAEGAASAKNEHPTRWVVIHGREPLEAIYRVILDWVKQTGEKTLFHSMVTLGRDPVTCGASCAIIGCCPPQNSFTPETDTAIALTQTELMLVNEGLSTCWSGYLRRLILTLPEVRALARIPEGYDPYAVLLVGKQQGEQYLRPAYRPAARIDWVE